MGNSSGGGGGGGCAYKNQGETIFELKHQIYPHITATKAKLEQVKNLVNENNTKFTNARNEALKVYNELNDKYNREYSGYNKTITNLKEEISGINSGIKGELKKIDRKKRMKKASENIKFDATVIRLSSKLELEARFPENLEKYKKSFIFLKNNLKKI